MTTQEIRLTTEHPLSSHNQPVLVVDGVAYGVDDRISNVLYDPYQERRISLTTSAGFIVAEHGGNLGLDRDLAIKFIKHSSAGFRALNW